ncbi:MAG TPA: DUF6073 family protein [Gemmatimonadaceae bacterium]|nr:DUF6073 family protein [Gemmatimonadaceae bacterium]
MPARRKKGSGHQIQWGPQVNLTGLKDHYAGTKAKPYTVPPGGIDNLALHSTDIFTIPGKGEFTVDFSGYFRVARDNPTTKNWTTFELLVNIIDLKLNGENRDIGPIAVSLNPDILSSGQIFPATSPQGAAKCRIATGVVFDLPQVGISVFNKEPILLMNEHVTSIPPVDDPNGHALLFMLPLFDRKDPSGKPLAYLTSLRYGADNYITESKARSFQASGRKTN